MSVWSMCSPMKSWRGVPAFKRALLFPTDRFDDPRITSLPAESTSAERILEDQNYRSSQAGSPYHSRFNILKWILAVQARDLGPLFVAAGLTQNLLHHVSCRASPVQV